MARSSAAVVRSSFEDTRDVETQLFKTKLCAFFQSGNCRRRVCRFAHGRGELREQPDLTKTTMCKFMEDRGYCAARDCKFAHHRDELRGAARAVGQVAGLNAVAGPADIPSLHVQGMPAASGLALGTSAPFSGGPWGQVAQPEANLDLSGVQGTQMQSGGAPFALAALSSGGGPAVEGQRPELDPSRLQQPQLVPLVPVLCFPWGTGASGSASEQVPRLGALFSFSCALAAQGLRPETSAAHNQAVRMTSATSFAPDTSRLNEPCGGLPTPPGPDVAPAPSFRQGPVAPILAEGPLVVAPEERPPQADQAHIELAAQRRIASDLFALLREISEEQLTHALPEIYFD